MNLSLGLCQSTGFRLSQTFETKHASGYKKFAREALKAFRRLKVGNEVFYTCNVDRLKECNRLGDAKEIALWRTHFFLCSPHFNDVNGVIFNARPGTELALATSLMQIDSLSLALGPNEVVNLRNGSRRTFDEPLVYASEAKTDAK